MSGTTQRLAAVGAGVGLAPAPAAAPFSTRPAAAGTGGRIGIIGGSGPEAGADLFLKVLAAHRAQLGDAYLGDASAPNVLLSQVAAIGGGTPDEKWTALSAAVLELAPLVAAFSVACNALHGFEPQIRKLLTTHSQPADKFVSMTAATTAHCSHLSPGKLAVFGGATVMDVFGASPYRSLGQMLGKEVVMQDVLSPEQREVLSGVIKAVKVNGSAIPDKTVRDFEDLLRSVEECETTLLRYAVPRRVSGWLLTALCVA